MTFTEYQKQAMFTAIYPNIGNNLTYPMIALAGEVGELLNKYKKVLRGDHKLNKEELLDELGDVLWYCGCIATELKADLGDVAQENLNKLSKRHKK